MTWWVLINRHNGIVMVMLETLITATSSFITQPIAEHFGVDLLIATDPEIVDGCANFDAAHRWTSMHTSHALATVS